MGGIKIETDQPRQRLELLGLAARAGERVRRVHSAR